MARKLPGRAIQAGTITVTQLDSATSTVIQTGGGPKITNVQIANNSWTVLDDTAVDTAGGYLVITGTGFVTGALVYFNQTAASAVTFMSSTTLRVTVPALTAGTYVLYVINPDGGSAIRVPGVTASASPAWQTASALPDQYDGVVITLGLVATDAASYAVTSGSLPPGLSLAANTGVISGTVTGVSNDTTYTFTVTATDAQLQDSPRTFTVTITVSDPYFRLTTLLLGGEQGNTVVRDSSVNNFNLTVAGDARASNFTPYGTGWSNYFASGQSNYLTTPGNVPSITGDYTAETWVYLTSLPNNGILFSSTNSLWEVWVVTNNTVVYYTGAATRITTSLTVPLNTWTHVALVRASGIAKIYINGVADAATYSSNATIGGGSDALYIGRDPGVSGGLNGYLSNYRIAIGAAVYTSNFTPSTSPLGATSGGQNPPTGTQTYLLTCQSNRFVDNKSNPVTLTVTGTPSIVAFNPFNITNTGDSGSMYFDGTGDWLVVSHGSGIALSSGSTAAENFTVECWFYPSVGGIFQALFTKRAAGEEWNFSLFNTNIFKFGSSAADYTSGLAVTISAWNHLAVSWDGTTLRTYVNGVAGTTHTNFSLTAGTNTLAIGSGQSGSSVNPVNGYISNARILKGSGAAIYTGATITVPTSPITAIANTQLLTLQYRQPHNNHSFQDSSTNNFLITRNGNASQGTFSPFSQTGWSNYFDGTGDYLSLGQVASAGPLDLSTAAFTIEAWIFVRSTGVEQDVICSTAATVIGNSTVDWVMRINGSGNLLLVTVNGSTVTSTTSSGAITFNAWNHIAVTRNGASATVYINGTGTTGSVASTTNTGRYISIGRLGSSQDEVFGYISNLRVVKGVVVYTGNFTPPTSPLTSTQSTGTNISAITGTSTSLLTCQSNRFIDNSGNTFTFTPGGNTSVVAFSPFAPTQVYSPAIHGGSAYFDGSGDGLTLQADSRLDLTADFTIEFYVYLVSNNGFVCNGTQGGSGTWRVYINTNGSVNFSMAIGTWAGVDYTTTTGLFSLNEWVHIAVTRSGSNFTTYINGFSRGTQSNSGSLINTGRVTQIGYYTESAGTTYSNFYLSLLRIIKGTAVYTAAFTPPTSPLTAIAKTQLLLNFTDAAILDRTGRNVVETVADARTSSVQVKYGTGAMSFDGTGDALYRPNSDYFNYGTGNFTIEFWMYYNSISGYQTIASLGYSPQVNTGWLIQTGNGDGKVIFYVQGSGTIIASDGGATISTGQWYHIAVVRNSGTTTIYRNGSSVGSGADTTNYTSTGVFYIGGGTSTGLNGAYFNGYLDDFRITKFARYTANFTPPTASHRLK